MSFRVERGERLAIVGPNGAGKSTTMAAIAGRLPTFRGLIQLDGLDLRAILPEARARIGFLPETVPCYDVLTVHEHLAFLRAFHPHWDQAAVDELLQRLRVDPAQQMGKLSKGTRVKVAYVAAEAIDPELLLLDEPTSGLDPVVRSELLEIVKERLRERPARALIFSTHLLEDIDQIADRVLLIQEGRLREDIPVAALSREGMNTAQALYARLRTHA
ncbi:MAG TPA: ABC transporter ATP-binding protein [Gemmatimonadaceae bacterium]